MKNWIDKKLEDSFNEFEKKKEIEKDVITIHVLRDESFKNFSVKSICDIILKKFNFGKL